MLSSTMIFRASALALLLGGTAAAQEGIEVQRLDALDPLEVGLSDGAMESTLWDGTHADMAVRVLDRLPGSDGEGYASVAVGELARVVLSSGGYPPHEGRGRFDLAVLRADRLLAAGGAFDAYDLLARTPNLNQSADLSRLHTELAFALADEAGACRTAAALLEDREQAYWQRVRAFCLALEGQTAAAELTAELARQGGEDAGYEQLLFAITLGTGLNADLPDIDSGLKLAMARRLDVSLDDAAASAGNAPGWMRRLLSAQSMPDMPVVDDPVSAVMASDGLDAADRTLLLEAVLTQSGDRETAALALGRLLSDAQARGEFVPAAHLYGREIRSLPITAETLDSGYLIAMASAVAGDAATARRWRNGLVDGPERPEPVAPQQTPVQLGGDAQPSGLLETAEVKPMPGDVMPEPEIAWIPLDGERLATLDLVLLAASDRIRRPEATDLAAQWRARHGSDATANLLALSMLGADMPAQLRSDLLDLPVATISPDLVAMDAAQRARARAETALLAIAVLNGAGDDLPADALARVVSGLHRSGLHDAAMILMVERLVEQGL